MLILSVDFVFVDIEILDDVVVRHQHRVFSLGGLGGAGRAPPGKASCVPKRYWYWVKKVEK